MSEQDPCMVSEAAKRKSAAKKVPLMHVCELPANLRY
jgi:hypothetical protein